MKKAIFLAIGFGLIITLLVPQARVWSHRISSEESTFHQVSQGEYFSKISLHYYDTAKYWRELALLNGAPNSDNVLPGARIFIPSRSVIQALHTASRPSPAENKLIHIQHDTPANLTEFVNQDRYLAEKEMSFPIILAGFGGLFLGGVMLGVVSYKKHA
jgi:hypothetical protein